MIRHLVAGVKHAFGLHRPGHNLAIFPDDVFLVSYPKSGNTWARFLIANLLYSERHPDWGNIDRLIPAPEVMSKRDFARMPRPRIIRTHDAFDPRYKQVIYIVRDPRDVALSQYHHHRKLKLIEDNHPFESFLARFLAGETNVHGSWKQNVASWLAARYGDPRFLLLRYEGMLVDTRSELASICSFMGVEATPERLSKVVEQSSPREMRKLEQVQADQCALTKDTRQDLPFVRTAKSGNWKSEMPDSSVVAIEAAWGPLMQWLGYELVSGDPAGPAESAFPISAMDGLVR
ncbi:MAG: sulfotransferase domain-containing protein [Terriglobales bacterium]